MGKTTRDWNKVSYTLRRLIRRRSFPFIQSFVYVLGWSFVSWENREQRGIPAIPAVWRFISHCQGVKHVSGVLLPLSLSVPLPRGLNGELAVHCTLSRLARLRQAVQLIPVTWQIPTVQFFKSDLDCSPDYVSLQFARYHFILYYITYYYIAHSQLIYFNWTFNLKIYFLHT